MIMTIGNTQIKNLNFGEALAHLKNGYCVARDGWNGKGMFLVFVGADDWNADSPGMSEEEGEAETAPFIAMKTADNKLVPWLASQTDMLAEDWILFQSLCRWSRT
jgi:hypothetical protein